MPKIHDINEGYTLDFLIPAFFIALIGGVGAIISIFITLVLVLLAIALIALRSGVQIDIPGKRIRVYKAIGNIKLGKWSDLSEYDHVRLKLTQESQVMNMKSISNNIRVKTYDLMISKQGGAEFMIHDFSSYPLARRALGVLVNDLGFSFVDGVEERKRQAAQRSAERRR